MKASKMFAFCASLVLVSSCANFPVSAVYKDGIDVVVYSIGGDTSDPWHSWYRVMGEYGETYAINGFQLEKWNPSFSMEEIQLGDILTCDGMSWTVLESAINKTVISPDNFEECSVSITGSIFDNPETQTYEVTDFTIEETTFDNNETYHLLHCNLAPQFETWKKQFSFDFYLEREKYTPAGYVDWFSLQEGDVVSCITYGVSPVFVAEKLSTAPSGDADGNGTLDILDVISVNKAVLGKEDLDPERIPYIDFNSNSIPDSDDALTMLKKIVGLA